MAVIGRAGVGVDNIDISAATRKGVVVMIYSRCKYNQCSGTYDGFIIIFIEKC